MLHASLMRFGCLAALRQPLMTCCAVLFVCLWCDASRKFITAQEPRQRQIVIQHNLLEVPTAKAALQLLQQPVTLVWEKKTLREGLEDITHSYRLAVWLDRRIDPTQRVTLAAAGDGKPADLSSILEEIARQTASEFGLVENVAYFGPPGVVARVQRAAIELHDQISRSRGDQQAQMKPFSWSELATPTSVLDSIASNWDMRCEFQMPHDLLHAGSVGSCNLATQLSLLGSGFELEPELLPNETIDFKPLGPMINWQFTYDVAALDSASLRGPGLARLLNEIPGQVRTRRGQVLVEGPTSLHMRLQPRSRVASQQDLDQRTWSLEVRNKSTEVVLNTLAQSMGLEIDIDSDIPLDKLQRLISFDVANAGIDALLQAVAEAAELQLERRGLRISVTNR
ncbi:MAG: hypothetical protein NXI32_08290 [bacterium]|nr:hypothetical protein [bacterium]